jgi:hypothetical protein
LLHVSSLVPDAYPAHGRVFHHARRLSGDVRWAEIAAVADRTLHAGTRFNELVGWPPDAQGQVPPAPWGAPNDGSLLPDECAAVADVLAGCTSTPDECWVCLWEGFGWLSLKEVPETTPRVALENRNCLLFRGPVSAATAFRSEPWFQSPTLWWPTDRAWCVATEVDGYSTYFAGTALSLHALMGHPSLEVLECGAEQEIDPSPFTPRGAIET